MKKYIDADALISECEEEIVDYDEDLQKHFIVKAVPTEYIEDFPAADVEEVKHGMWIPIQGEYHWAETGVVDPITLGYKCSVCGEEEKFKYRYCHCGAKMDGKETEK